VRRTLAAGIGIAIALLGLELGLRFLLFSDSGLARRLGGSWRKAEWYADTRGEDAYWKLQYLFLPPEKRSGVPGFDPTCGWLGHLQPGTYEPPDLPDLRGRRPILLYGDSYARCTTAPSHCYPALLEHGRLGERYAIVNLGVGGYGLDQVLFLLRATIDRWKDLQPIVVIGFLVDDDFHRDTLTFRNWPKRRFALKDGRLVVSGPPLSRPRSSSSSIPSGSRATSDACSSSAPGSCRRSWRARLRRPFGGARSRSRSDGRSSRRSTPSSPRGRSSTSSSSSTAGTRSSRVRRPRGRTSSPSKPRRASASRGSARVPTSSPRSDGDVALAGARLFQEPSGNHGHYNDLGNWVALQALT
jgi:hypothetical protein